jgi:F420-dependent oxidoreductase-like protein
LRLSTILGDTRDPQAVATQLAELERAGLDIAWVAEAYGFDGPTYMGFLAARTERLQIGSAILNIYSRTPALLVQTAAGLDNVSGGRAILGLGASGPQVIEGWHGVAYDKPVSRTREVVEIVRSGLRREVVTHEGLYPLPLPPGRGTGLGKPLKLMSRPVRPDVPLYLAALGAANVALAAEVADGWLPLFFLPEKAHEVWGEALAAGGALRSPDLGPLEVVAGGLLAIGDDVDAELDKARPGAALYIGGMGARGKNFYFDLACRYGYESEATKIQELYLEGRKEEAAAAVPLEFLQLTNLVGSAGFVRERIAAYREAGVTVLNLTLLGHDDARAVAQVKEWSA